MFVCLSLQFYSLSIGLLQSFAWFHHNFHRISSEACPLPYLKSGAQGRKNAKCSPQNDLTEPMVSASFSASFSDAEAGGGPVPGPQRFLRRTQRWGQQLRLLPGRAQGGRGGGTKDNPEGIDVYLRMYGYIYIFSHLFHVSTYHHITKCMRTHTHIYISTYSSIFLALVAWVDSMEGSRPRGKWRQMMICGIPTPNHFVPADGHDCCFQK